MRLVIDLPGSQDAVATALMLGALLRADLVLVGMIWGRFTEAERAVLQPRFESLFAVAEQELLTKGLTADGTVFRRIEIDE
jgi:hypothetical protein